MPWTSLSTQSWSTSEGSIYKGSAFTKNTAAIAWGLSINASASGSLPRRRLGFLNWYFLADSRELYLPTVEVISGVDGRPLALAMFTDAMLTSVPGLDARVSTMGYAFAPDRGCVPCSAALLRLDP